MRLENNFEKKIADLVLFFLLFNLIEVPARMGCHKQKAVALLFTDPLEPHFLVSNLREQSQVDLSDAQNGANENK